MWTDKLHCHVKQRKQAAGEPHFEHIQSDNQMSPRLGFNSNSVQFVPLPDHTGNIQRSKQIAKL